MRPPMILSGYIPVMIRCTPYRLIFSVETVRHHTQKLIRTAIKSDIITKQDIMSDFYMLFRLS